ncbi:MAG: hypothetical protein V1900_04250 [Candidatus Aenigmatarchaeota archaeon]
MAFDRTRSGDVKFETIKSEEIKFKENNFIEIARKKATGPNGETIFISISRGFVTFNGEKKYKTSVTIPVDAVEVVDFITAKLKDML